MISGEPMSDREIITAIRDGDGDAFELLIKKYQTKVFHHCLRMVRDREECVDLTQEVFLKVFRNIHKYEHAYAFYTWLYKITANCCIDYLRNSKRKIKKVPLYHVDSWDQSEIAKDQDIPDETYVPENTLLNLELREILNDAIGQLSDNLRSTILLKEIEGCSYAEIAEISDCSIGTVKSRMHRAREELKTYLKPYV
jgi:RNA polymerase sigma-70 factor (ECF subfamily)